jgi:branched-chain amino acid transport system substrate-binding protein
MRLPKLLAGLAVASVALAACGTSTASGPTIKGTIKIGIDLPVSFGDASDGQPTQNGAKLAISQAKQVCGVTHSDACFTLSAFPLDDATAAQNGHDPAQGAANVTQYVADSQVLGMVGPFNSSVAKAEIPIANQASLAMISPANTNECLTQEPADGHCKGTAASLRPTGKNNYFRVCTTDLIQGPAGADFAFKKLGKTKVFVFNDQQTYGLGIAQNFAKQFAADGGTVLNPNDLGGFDPTSTSDFHSQINRAKSLQADVVYFGGTTSDKGGQIRKQMLGILDVPYVAGDGISGNQFATDAGDNANNSYFTVAGPYPQKLSTAATFVAAYTAAYGTVGAYSAQAYDAANIIIQAISRAIDDAGGNTPSRAQVTAEVAKTQNYHGAIGTTSFDSNGDTTLKIITIYKWTSSTDKSGTYVDQVTVS